MKIGIDKIGFYIPHLFVDMQDLAVARDEDPAKYKIGIGQSEMAVAPITQDSVTLAANAALQIIDDEDREKIDFIMFATESSIDQSKSAGVYVQQLIGLKREIRSIELKHACYSATAALQLAKGYIHLHPDRKVLILAADIARYGLRTPGEVTQGAGAVAMIVSANPRILALGEKSTYVTQDVMDFWRPNYSDFAYVDGKFSNEMFISFFNNVWEQYKKVSDETLDDFTAICFHLPYTKMGLKALRTVLEEGSEQTQDRLAKHYEASTTYNRRVGNIYTASLYLSLISLLENSAELPPGSKLGFFSYGSGAVGEFFTGVLEANYQDVLRKEFHQNLLDNRQQIDVSTYEKIFEQTLPKDGSSYIADVNEDPAPICLRGIENHMRQYVRK